MKELVISLCIIYFAASLLYYLLPHAALLFIKDVSAIVMQLGLGVHGGICLKYVILNPTTEAHRDAVRCGGMEKMRAYISDHPGLVNYYVRTMAAFAGHFSPKIVRRYIPSARL